MESTGSNNKKKTPRPLLYYYGLVFLTVLIFNWLIMPMFLSRQVTTANY